MVPVIGEAADGVNALIYLGQGDIKNAAISGAALVPGIGSFGTGARLAIKGTAAVAGAATAAKGVSAAGAVVKASHLSGVVMGGIKGADHVKDAEKVAQSAENVIKGGLERVFKKGSISIDDIKANPSAFSGKSADEIAQVLKESGYDVTIQKSAKSKSGAEIIKINNPGGGKNISQVQVSPGGGRHGNNPYIKISTTDQGIIKIIDGSESLYKTDGKETATIVFSGGK
ncbi:hypothetical protein [Faecalispora anaeroviscerum]|uniref:hypothetical protein n=1 Tax=Faecalispora anaeroviscerum TaxID=2991836 RepID=UPI0024B964FA|nr:hypothetical protein [Faecalispora anaeroviscerum]